MDKKLTFLVDNEIVDRDEESNRLLQDIKNYTRLTIKVLYAPTAIGKSSVSQKLVTKLKKNDIFNIVIKTSPINKTELEEWSFLSSIFDAFQDRFNNTPNSFENFINNHKYIQNQIIQSDLNFFKNSNIKNIAFNFTLMLIKKGYESANDYLVQNEKSFLYLKQEFINYIFSNVQMVLIIDNLQIIDESSLSFLRRCFYFNNSKKVFIIFEYTTINENTEMVQKAVEIFANENIIISCVKIERTDSKYIIDIIDKKISDKPKEFDFNKNLINHYIENNSGNIRELIDYSINYNKTIISDPDKTLECLLNLSDKELSIIITIVEFDGKMKLQYLRDLTKYARLYQLDDIFESLIQKKLIILSNTYVLIAHASIIDRLKINDNYFDAEKKSTISYIKEYIESLLIKSNKLNFIFLKVILNIYKDTYPEKIGELFKSLEESVLIKLPIKTVWKYINSFIDVTVEHIEEHISLYKSILRMCFKFELYDEGYNRCLLQIEKRKKMPNDKKFILYKMMFLAACDKHYENIEFYNEIRPRYIDDIEMDLNINLAVLSSYRSLGDISTCLKIHKILKNSKYKQYKEYGYRNRLVDMYLPRSKTIPYLKKSVKAFNDLEEQQAKTLITYTHVLGGLGKIRAARKKINKAATLLSGKLLGNHMILVNQAVLNLVEGNFKDETFSLLNMAETSAIVPFDKLAIIVNKLVWCYENNRFDISKSLEDDAMIIINLEPDKHIHSLLYYNLYSIYTKQGKYLEARRYLSKAKENMRYCKPVEERITNSITKDNRFIIGKPWHICYLAYWTYDVLIGEESSS